MTSLVSRPENPMKHILIPLANCNSFWEADYWHVVRFEAKRALRGCARSLPTQHTDPRGAHPGVSISHALTHNIKRVRKISHPSFTWPADMPRQTVYLAEGPTKTRCLDMQSVQPRFDSRSYYVKDTIHSR
jgi:hypothetical protein